MDNTIKKISKFELIDLILVCIIGITEFCLLGHYFFNKMPSQIIWHSQTVVFLFLGIAILGFFLLFIIYKLSTKEWTIINKNSKLGWDRTERLDWWYFSKNLLFCFAFGFIVTLLFSINLLPILINTFHSASVFLALIIIILIGTLIIEINIFATADFLNKGRLYGYILNICILLYFYFIVKMSGLFILFLLILVLSDILFSSSGNEYSKFWDIALVSLVVLLIGLILLVGLFSMDYNKKEIRFAGYDSNIVCTPKNNFGFVLEDSLVDCNLMDANVIATKDTVILAKLKDSKDYNINITNFDENRIIFNVPENSYQLGIIDLNKEYIADNLNLMTTEDYNNNRKEFGKYLFLLLGVIFLTIPLIIKTYIDVGKELDKKKGE